MKFFYDIGTKMQKYFRLVQKENIYQIWRNRLWWLAEYWTNFDTGNKNIHLGMPS